ncbi:esterase/lipase family protein [Shewanella acanthi]|uniref:esterase/lipase family protein n=1 Tax=Shewanella acanthi TaxID=2864212 RepID=UPI001C65A60C|nr:alpha/beta hydrolase [Shewanella acanthi]QYJ80171.1 alpha/beta hydrolase [Shewanella acanthi]
MNVLFVHGMGRSPLSGWPLMYQLEQAGCHTQSFGYLVCIEPFSSIQARLEKRICELASFGPYILVGHSLGGVLIRAALGRLQQDMIPAPEHVFLLGSPIMPSRLAQKLSPNILFRTLTRDCGQMLASSERMAAVGAIVYPTTSIVGVMGISWKQGPFHGDENDGVVSVSEVSADWLTDEVKLPIVHSFLPSSKQVAGVILARLHM